MPYQYKDVSLARRQALQILFQKEFLGVDIAQATQDDELLVMSDCPKGVPDMDLVGEPLSEYAAQLIEGVGEHLTDIDAQIAAVAQNWTLERMPLVDRNIIRLACFEVIYCKDVPPAVAINEAVEIAKSFGGDESPKFVNGVLGRIAAQNGVEAPQVQVEEEPQQGAPSESGE